MLQKSTADAAWFRTARYERLSTRAALVLGSLATLLLWLGIVEILLQSM